MENIMMLPASYCVMNEEEMTYTTGGASRYSGYRCMGLPSLCMACGRHGYP